MTLYNGIIQSYCTALKANDYQVTISLFAKDAKVISYIAGEKPAPEFFQNLFKTSRRTKVELKNLFIGAENKPTVAAYIYLENILNEKLEFQFETVDIFEFNAENKITTLRIIMDTYPLRKLLADAETANAKLKQNHKRQITEFIDDDRSVMSKFYDITEKTLSESKLLEEMRKLIETDKDFYDPYLIVADELFAHGKNKEAQIMAKEAYERAVARISDSKGRWPKIMPWGFLENRHLMRALEYYADVCWNEGNIDKALDIYRRLLRANPHDNQGARYNILAIRMGLGPEKWKKPFEVKDKGNIIGLNAFKLTEWFSKNAKIFPDDFEWFIKLHADDGE